MPALNRIDIRELVRRSAHLTPTSHPAEFSPQCQRLLALAERYPSATAFVLFENLDMSSSHLGDNTVMVIGPDNTYPHLEAVYGRHIHDLPSQRQYAVAYCPIDAGVLEALRFSILWSDIR